MSCKDWIAVVQALATWGLVVVAVVTLKRASATVLQPIKTEAFKAQLEELRELLRFFNTRDEVGLRELFGLDQLVNANAVWLHDRFFHDVFGAEVSPNERPYSSEQCASSIVKDRALGSTAEFATHPSRGQKVAIATFKPGPGDDPRVWWSNFAAEELKIPTKVGQSIDHLRMAATSPLMPDVVAKRIREVIGVVEANVSSLFQVLSAAGRQMPARFPPPSAPESFLVGWVADRFYGQLSAIEPRVVALNDAIRRHLSVEALMKPW